MLNQELEFIRKRHKNLMPEYMTACAIKLSNTAKPDETRLSKSDFLTAWIRIFDSESDQHDDLLQFNIMQLKTACTWTLQHFAELDLGGNYKWLVVIRAALNLTQEGKWNRESQNELISSYITDTRWYDY